MKLHGNAALSWHGRRRLAGGCCRGMDADGGGRGRRRQRALCRKWVARYRPRARPACDRSSAPRRVANRTPQERVEVIVALRRLRFTAAEIAEALAMALSTVSGSSPARARPAGPARARAAVATSARGPGELVHVDVKRLGRIQGGAGKRVLRRPARQAAQPAPHRRRGHRRYHVGWEFVHIAVDDYSRLAYAEVLPDEKAATAIGFLRRAVAFYRATASGSSGS